MPDSSAICVTAPAKVNLFLHITGRRDDGYHLLESLFVFTRKGDRITVSASADLCLNITGPFAEPLSAAGGAADNNLVTKAARALAAAAGVEAKALITLEKNLPIASGIGGGSADAAATLLALNTFWALDWPLKQLEPIALALGADIPACLYQNPLFVQGVGEKLSPVSLAWPQKAGQQAAILLVNPGIALSTPAVFAAYKASGTAFDRRIADPAQLWHSPAALGTRSQNSLEAPAISLRAEINDILQCLEKCEAVRLARMSGSGATCFGLFDSLALAQQAAEKIARQQPNWWLMADEIALG